MNKKILNKTGLSILEMLIVAGLLGIFLSVIGVVCVDGIKAFHKSKNKLTTQQQAQLSLDRLCRELNESYAPGIKIKKTSWNGGDPNELWDAISFPTSRNNDDASGDTSTLSGKLQWPRYIIYFKKFKTGNLFRRVISVTGYPTDTLYPEALPDSKLNSFLNPSAPVSCPPPYNVSSSGTITNDRNIARDIYNISFDFYNPTLADYNNINVINISVESRINIGKDAIGNDIFENVIITTIVKPTNR